MPKPLAAQEYVQSLSRAVLEEEGAVGPAAQALGRRLALAGLEASDLGAWLRQAEMEMEHRAAEMDRTIGDHWRADAALFQADLLLGYAAHWQEAWQGLHADDAQARLGVILEAADLGTWSYDLGRRHFHGDGRFQALHGAGLSRPIATREAWLKHIHPADVERFLRATLALVSEGTPLDCEYRVIMPHGGERDLQVQASLLRDSQDRPMSIFGVCVDITARCRAQRELEELSQRDPLTGMLNRRGLSSSLQREANRRRRTRSEMQALFIDLDDFKKINDVYGHTVGDEVLRRVSTIVRGTVRARDHVARIGGDEFLVILPSTTRQEAVPVANKVHRAIVEAPIADRFPHLRVGASVGMVSAAKDDEVVQDLLVRTERALHSAKRLGKGRIFHENNLFRGDEARAMSFTEILGELHQPSTYFAVRQVLVNTAGDTFGYEFLTRSRCRALDSPADFLRFALDAGVAGEVDLHAFRTCCEATRLVDPGMHCHLNLLPSTLERRDTEELLGMLPAERDFQDFCLEISEQEAIRDPRRLIEPVARLRDAGVRIGLDDVGHGHSSLEVLLLLEPEVVKIDRQLVHGIARDGQRRRALGNLLRIVTTWGGAAIAEGLEEEDDLAVLEELGVTWVQGFLFGRPGR